MYGGKPILYDFERTKDDALFLIAQERSGSALYLYEKANGDGKESGNKAELTLFTLKANEDLEMLIRLYRDSNPEVKITLRTGITEEQNIPVSDALRLLNTDLLSGQGPDIICFDNLNYSAFAENKMLLDLSPTIQDISRTENLYSNMLNAYKGGDGLYVIPTKFSFPGIIGPADLVDASGDLDALKDQLVQMHAQNNKPPVLDGQYFEKAVRILYQTYVIALTGESNVPTRAQLETFYKTVKTLDDICDGRDARKKDDRNDIKGLIPYSDQEALRVIAGLNQISIQDVMGVRDMQALYTIKERGGLKYGSLHPKGINVFVGQNMIGVNANSEYKDEARKFVAFPLSKDTQNRVRPPAWENGFPVNKDALSEQLEHAEIAGSVVTNEKNEDIQIAYKAFTAEDIVEILAFPDQLTAPVHSDLILYAIVTESLEKYHADEISLKDIVNTAANKLDLYIKEGR
jgi:ABC-type glycerol-3-phosphate transport system substrate-binding protein